MSGGAKRLERRTFLCVMGAAGVAASAVAGCGGEDPPAPFSAGRVADHPVGVWKLYAANNAIVGRDAEGFFAMSALCSHEQYPLDFRDAVACTVPSTCTAISMTGNTRCLRHGSQFDGNGTVTRPQATVPLPHYRLTVAGGEITVNPAAVVAADVRSTGG